MGFLLIALISDGEYFALRRHTGCYHQDKITLMTATWDKTCDRGQPQALEPGGRGTTAGRFPGEFTQPRFIWERD
jgi:hypothetical protein